MHLKSQNLFNRLIDKINTQVICFDKKTFFYDKKKTDFPYLRFFFSFFVNENLNKKTEEQKNDKHNFFFLSIIKFTEQITNLN